MKENKALPTKYWLYEPDYSSTTPAGQLFVHYFDSLPSTYKVNDNFDDGIINFILEQNYELIIITSSKINHKYRNNEEYLFKNDHEKIMIKLEKNITDLKYKIILTFFYDAKQRRIEDYTVVKQIDAFKKIEEKSTIKLLKNESGFLDTESFDMKKPIVDISLNYGDSFAKKHEAIVKKLNTDDESGIVLLHGDPGTGKTTYIKFLAGLIKEKDVIFVPPSTAEVLSEPSIIPFLMYNKNSILIIEDAEKVISDRNGNGSSVGVSNILNLTDGILGDCLSIQIIATFNTKRENIDSALLRKGRLIAEHKFTNLSVDNANKLLKHLGKNSTVNVPTSLADIYNIDTELFVESGKGKSIGFN